MAVEIRRGFQGLAEYVDVVEGDPAKAERVRQKQAEVARFLADEGLSEVITPRAEVARIQKERAEQKHIRYQNHRAAVAQEALRVEGEEFAHDTKASVVRSLKERIAGGDPRLIPGYTDSSLGRQIVRSAETGFHVASGPTGSDSMKMPLVDLLVSEDFTRIFSKYNGWVETFGYASRVLPPDTDTATLMFLLLSYSKDVGPDLTQFRTVQGRITEIRRGLLQRPAA